MQSNHGEKLSRKNVHAHVKTRGMECVFLWLWAVQIHRVTHKHKKPAPPEHGSEDDRVRSLEKVALPSSRYILKEDVYFPSLKSSSWLLEAYGSSARGWGWTILFYSPWISPVCVCFYTQQHDVAISSSALFHVAGKYIFIYLISTTYSIG